MPVRARPDRDLVAPPELARDAPVRRLLERLDREPVLALRVVADAPLAQRRDRRLRELVHAAPPLRRDERLDPRVAPLARADGVTVRLALLERARAPPPRRRPVAFAVFWSRPSKPSAVIRPSGPITVSARQPVVAADVEVHRVVAGRDLDRSGAELGIDPRVRDHGDAALDDGDDDLAADRVAVARRRPGAPRPRRRRASSRAARSRSRSRPRRPRTGSGA